MAQKNVLFTVSPVGGDAVTLRARVEWDERLGFDQEAVEAAANRAVSKAMRGRGYVWLMNHENSADRALVESDDEAGKIRSQEGNICRPIKGDGYSVYARAWVTAEVL